MAKFYTVIILGVNREVFSNSFIINDDTIAEDLAVLGKAVTGNRITENKAIEIPGMYKIWAIGTTGDQTLLFWLNGSIVYVRPCNW